MPKHRIFKKRDVVRVGIDWFQIVQFVKTQQYGELIEAFNIDTPFAPNVYFSYHAIEEVIDVTNRL